jgi:Ca-activated chloride channel family protein
MGKFGYVILAVISLAVVAAALFLVFGPSGEVPAPAAVKRSPAAGNPATKATPKADSPAVEVLFASSDGKKEWVNDVVKAFNDKKVQVAGKAVVVKAKHIRGGESRLAILDGKEKPTLWGPAGRSWVDLINADWEQREQKPFMTDVRDTVRTALVIATWEPMARALGWPNKPIGWSDLQRVAVNPKGWAALGHPEWGAFRFAHSHPDYSNSAMLSFLSLIYAAAGKTSGLTWEDLKRPSVVSAVSALERSIVHYGESSSWLTEKLCTRGPSYLSAVTVYESSVVKANDKFKYKLHKVVAIYPKEGTFWETHPVGIVNASWVTPEQRQGAKLFLDFLVSREQQAKAPRYGFRPALPGVPLAAPFDAEHGIEPDAQRRELAYVSDDLFMGANKLWHTVKKKAAVWVLLDTSGWMDNAALEAAKRGCAAFLRKMEPEDVARVITFNTYVNPQGRPGKIREVRSELISKVNEQNPDGTTRLYDAIFTALQEIDQARKKKDEDRLYGIVVLTNGHDSSSQVRRSQLIAELPKEDDTRGTRVFTIGYGNKPDEELLREMSERSNAVMVKGDVADVEKLYHQLSAYF